VIWLDCCDIHFVDKHFVDIADMHFVIASTIMFLLC
jgi:hypothetical protein